MIETTLSQLRQLKLTGMASALQTQLDQPGTYELTVRPFCCPLPLIAPPALDKLQ